MSESEEWAKAAQGATEFGTTSVRAIEKFGGFLAKIIGEPAKDAIGIFGDKLKFVRWKNKLIIMDKVNQILDERGTVNTRQMLPKFAVPIMEYATLEEDESLQNIWCRLIANGLDPNFNMEIRYAFIEIIRNLTSLDAKILKYIYDDVMDTASVTQAEHLIDCPVNVNNIIENISASDEEIYISLGNLKRVQCIWDNDLLMAVRGIANAVIRDKSKVTPIEEGYTLTALGYAFLRSCIV